MEIKELKAKAYDTIGLIEAHQNEIMKLKNELNKINDEIRALSTSEEVKSE